MWQERLSIVQAYETTSVPRKMMFSLKQPCVSTSSVIYDSQEVGPTFCLTTGSSLHESPPIFSHQDFSICISAYPDHACMNKNGDKTLIR